MNATKLPKATIEIRMTHFAILEPVVPEIRDLLKFDVLEFDAGGPLGHTVTRPLSVRFSRVIRHRTDDAIRDRDNTSEVLVLPQGAIPEVITHLNGVEKQRARAEEMVFSIPHILSYISHVMTLEPGDLVATGTPAGVGRLSSGDTVVVEIRDMSSGPKGRVIAQLTNPVSASSSNSN